MEQLYKKILIATDGSKNNIRAVKEAMRIARACGSTVYAIYVVDTGVLNVAALSDGEEYAFRTLKDEGEKALGQIKKMAGGAKVEARLLYGKPASEITRFAAENDVDLIVVGAVGKSALEAILLGSVADRVIRTAGCPVLVVKS